MSKFSFFEQFLKSYIHMHRNSDYETIRDQFLELCKPTVQNPPTRMGAKNWPSEHKTEKDITIIIANHLSDMDQVLILFSIMWHDKTQFPIKAAFFVNSAYFGAPLIGKFLQQISIGVKPGDDHETICLRIRKFLAEGYNTFILFPEGRFLCEAAYLHSRTKMFDTQQMGFKHLLFPRFGAWNALLAELEPRIIEVVDVSILYQGHVPWKSLGLHTDYPSVFYNMSNKVDSPIVYTEVIKRDPSKPFSVKWLEQRWREKDILLGTFYDPVLDPFFAEQKKEEAKKEVEVKKGATTTTAGATPAAIILASATTRATSATTATAATGPSNNQKSEKSSVLSYPQEEPESDSLVLVSSFG